MESTSKLQLYKSDNRNTESLQWMLYRLVWPPCPNFWGSEVESLPEFGA